MAAILDVEVKPQDVHRYLQQFGWDLEKRRGK